MANRGSDVAATERPTVLIVEDEWLIAIDLAETVEAAGCEVAGPVHSVAAAMALIDSRHVDGGLLDVNLRGETSYLIAEALASKGIPFAFLSGYASSQLDAGYAHHRLLAKPVELPALHSCLDSMLKHG